MPNLHSRGNAGNNTPSPAPTRWPLTSLFCPPTFYCSSMGPTQGKPEVRGLNDGVSLWEQRKGAEVGEDKGRPLSTLDLLFLEWAPKGPQLYLLEATWSGSFCGSLSLSFLVCKLRVRITPTSQGCLGRLPLWKCPAWCLPCCSPGARLEGAAFPSPGRSAPRGGSLQWAPLRGGPRALPSSAGTRETPEGPAG